MSDDQHDCALIEEDFAWCRKERDEARAQLAAARLSCWLGHEHRIESYAWNCKVLTFLLVAHLVALALVIASYVVLPPAPSRPINAKSFTHRIEWYEMAKDAGWKETE